MHSPLVSVICLCYNQAAFVKEAVASVLAQTYPAVEIIVVDDASTDGSAALIGQLCEAHPALQFMALTTNVGNCAAFNRGLARARGAYIVDLACDDVMEPERLARQVACFEQLGPAYGVVFSDARYIDERGAFIRDHTSHLLQHNLIDHVPTGDVYTEVLSTYFICSPTMMMRRGVLEELNGYDESLAYEDFDFWVRSSRHYQYAYLPEKLMSVRRTATSMSAGWYKVGDRQLHSTYLVCKKAQQLNRTPADHRALIQRVRYELRQSVFSENRHEATLFFKLLQSLERPARTDRLLIALSRTGLPLAFLRAWYQRLRFAS